MGQGCLGWVRLITAPWETQEQRSGAQWRLQVGLQRLRTPPRGSLERWRPHLTRAGDRGPGSGGPRGEEACSGRGQRAPFPAVPHWGDKRRPLPSSHGHYLGQLHPRLPGRGPAGGGAGAPFAVARRQRAPPPKPRRTSGDGFPRRGAAGLRSLVSTDPRCEPGLQTARGGSQVATSKPRRG